MPLSMAPVERVQNPVGSRPCWLDHVVRPTSLLASLLVGSAMTVPRSGRRPQWTGTALPVRRYFSITEIKLDRQRSETQWQR